MAEYVIEQSLQKINDVQMTKLRRLTIFRELSKELTGYSFDDLVINHLYDSP